MNDMERHIQQTNDRLQCIKEHLSSPQGFQHAARELLEWCSDPRAFQGPFENGLIHCLTIVSRVATQPGFDLDLGYRLLAVCAAHREKFTPKSAGLLSVWCEELGRLLLLRHQKSQSPDSISSKNPASMQPHMKNFHTLPPSDANGVWQGGPHQSLSVVTTVWGVTQTTQSGPFTHTTPGYTNTTMSTTPYTQPQHGFPGNPMHKAANPYANQSQVPQVMPQYRRDSSYTPGYPPTPTTPGINQPSMTAGHDYQAPPGALSAAAFVAAAATATATATATASMVALQEQQNQQQQMGMGMTMPPNQYAQPPQHQVGMGHQYHPDYMAQQRTAVPMGMGHGPASMGGGKAAVPSMYPAQRRATPYPNPQQMMQHKRGQYQNGTQFMQQQPTAMYNQAYLQKANQYPQQPMGSPTYNGTPQPVMRPNGPGPQYTNNQSAMYLMPNQYTRQPQPHPNYNQMNGQPAYSPTMNYQHSPIPGNPTPPITPGSTMPPYVSPVPQDIKPNCHEFKSHMPIKKESDELRLTFPVRDGIVLQPFRLEHNLAVSNHVFHLRESVYHTLMWRSDLELQLKCFHHEDRHMNTNWPASVTVSVNAKPLDIQRGDKTSHKPLYLKEVCQTGRNTIQITVTACCCSHLFVLQLVHRPSVRSVLQGLLRKRLLPAADCIAKIKRYFSMSMSNGPTLHDDGIEQTAMKVLLKCPITYRRITLPARGHDCKHIQCFDLESYLQLNCERGAWRCPVCNKQALLEGLEIDQYMWAILDKLRANDVDCDEVTIDSTASWQPTILKPPNIPIKDEEQDSCANGQRFMKAMSPSSLTMPTTHSLDMNQPSPYSMPPSVGPPPGQYTAPSYNGVHPFSPATPGTSAYSPDFPLSISETNLSADKLQRSNSHPIPPSPQDMGSSAAAGRLTDRALSQPALSGTPNHPSPVTNHPIPTPPQLTPATDDNVTSDLNFDPAAIINGDTPTPTLDLLPENIGDPMELLSYLGPSEPTNVDNGENGTNSNSASANDDLLALFEST